MPFGALQQLMAAVPILLRRKEEEKADILLRVQPAVDPRKQEVLQVAQGQVVIAEVAEELVRQLLAAGMDESCAAAARTALQDPTAVDLLCCPEQIMREIILNSNAVQLVLEYADNLSVFVNATPADLNDISSQILVLCLECSPIEAQVLLTPEPERFLNQLTQKHRQLMLQWVRIFPSLSSAEKKLAHELVRAGQQVHGPTRRREQLPVAKLATQRAADAPANPHTWAAKVTSTASPSSPTSCSLLIPRSHGRRLNDRKYKHVGWKGPARMNAADKATNVAK